MTKKAKPRSKPANTAAAFNGTNQSVAIPSTAAISPATTVTAEAWIKPATVSTTGFRSVLTKPESYSLQFNSGKLEFTIMQSGSRLRLQAPAGAIVIWSASLLLERLSFHLPMNG